MAYDIFISYKESDGTEYAEKLKKGLAKRGYTSAYFNKTNKNEEGSFIERLENAIKACKVFILVLSANAKQAILNKTAEKGSKAFDYVCWEITKAYENNKHVLILNTGFSFDPYLDKYKYDDMRGIEIYTGKDSKSSLLEAQIFEMDKILDEQGDLLKNAGVDVFSRMILRKVIYGVLSLKYKAKNTVGNYADKECIFNKQALEALCEYITKDNSITTAIEDCKTAEELTEYMNGTNHEILQDFCEHFKMEAGDKQKTINIKIKDPSMCKLYESDCWEVLEYLYNSYLAMNFHEDFSSIRKFYLNKTISDYVLALAWNRYFIKNKDKKRDLVYTIIPELIRTHNHAQRYLFALIEKGRFGNGEEWLFCDVGGEHSSQIKALFGDYYRDVFYTDMARSTFTERLFVWFNRNKERFVDFCLWLIKDYKCSDAEIWNYLIEKCDTSANRNSLEILKGFFSEYIQQKNFKVIFRMIEQGLSESVFFDGNQEKEKILFDLLCEAAANKEIVKKYGQGISKTFYIFWKKGQYADEIKQIAHGKYLVDKIGAFKNLYNVIEGITPENISIPKEKYEDILRETAEASDDKILEDNRFLPVLNNVWVTSQNADVYNRALSKLLNVCTYINHYYGFNVLLFAKKRWLNKTNRQRLFECIKDFADKYGTDAKLEDKDYGKMFDILKDRYFGDVRTAFKMKVFNNEGVSPEIKMNIFNLWYDDELKENLKEKIKENAEENNDTQKAFEILFKDKNKKWKNLQGWKVVHLYPLIEELLAFENFVELKLEIQKKLIHNVKSQKMFYPKIIALLDSFKENEDAWNRLGTSVKLAFVMHIDKIVQEFEKIGFINDFVESVIKDVSSMRKKHNEVRQEYGIKEETLMYHMISLYQKKPWKTAKLCAAAQVKWYGQLKHDDEEEGIDYNEKDMLFDRRKLFKTAASNPCIKELTCYLAKANYSVVRQNSSKISNDKDVLSDFSILFRNIIQGRIPLWFGVEVEVPTKAKMQWIENVDFESVVNDFKKYERSLEDEILDEAQKAKDNFEEKAIDFNEESEKIILWKDSEDDEKFYVLERKKLFARYFDNSMWYYGLKFNAFLFIPQMCEEVSFVSETDVFDVNKEMENVKKVIEEKFKNILIEFDPEKPKFDRFVAECGIDKDVKESINHFYNAYSNYLRLVAIKPQIAEAFSDYVRYMKYAIENMK